MWVFAEVAQDTRRQIIEHRAHQIEERTGKSPFPNGQGLPPTRQQREMPSDLGMIKDDSQFAGTSDRKEKNVEMGRSGEVGRATKGTWDKIRQSAFGGEGKDKGGEMPMPNLGGGRTGGAPSVRRGEDTRSKEQREFDEMLEKERQGGVIGDKWA